MVGPLVVISLFLNASTVALAVMPEEGSGRRLKGVVVDVENGLPLPGVQVLLVELGRVVLTDANGEFEFVGVAAEGLTLGVHISGYSSFHQRLGEPPADGLRIELQRTRFEDEISVTGSPFALNSLESSQQIDIVDGEDVKREGIASLGEALHSVAGVDSISTGAALGTPVVRGLSENRVRILNDGIGLNHQQFSWRHSPNVEAGFARNIEVVRGRASVLYSPDAMAGVINVIHAPLMVASPGERLWGGEVAAG